MGAAVGATIGYFYGTDEGAMRRASLARFIDDAVVDVDEVRRLWSKVHEAWERFDADRLAAGGRHDAARGWKPGGVA
jgi:hypothetical protein